MQAPTQKDQAPAASAGPDAAAAAAATAPQPQPAQRAAGARPVWLVAHPTHQWAEDVKALARQHGLQVIDTAAASEADIARAAKEPPSLTRREGAAQAAAPAAGMAADKPTNKPQKAAAAK